MVSIKEIIAYAKNYWTSGGWVMYSWSPMRAKICDKELLIDRYIRILRSPDNDEKIIQSYKSGYVIIKLQDKD